VPLNELEKITPFWFGRRHCLFFPQN